MSDQIIDSRASKLPPPTGLCIEADADGAIRVRLSVDSPAHVYAWAAAMAADVTVHGPWRMPDGAATYRNTSVAIERPGLRLRVGVCEMALDPEQLPPAYQAAPALPAEYGERRGKQMPSVA